MKRDTNCPKCGNALKPDYLYTGGYCWGCGHGVGPRRDLPPQEWGSTDESHVNNIEKWLSEEYRMDDEIQERIKGFALNKKTFGNCIMGYLRGLKILKAEIRRRAGIKNGMMVRRVAEKVVEVVSPIEENASEASHAKAHSGCICGWIHDDMLTKFTNPNDVKEIHKITWDRDRWKLVKYIHDGMLKGESDVSLGPFLQQYRIDGQTPRDILGNELHAALFESTGRDRGKIRLPGSAARIIKPPKQKYK